MSKGVKTVLGVVAAVAVPFVAAPLAAAIGLSSVVGTAAVGAGLGAASSAAMGNDPLLGAAMGGVGSAASAASAQGLFGAGSAAANSAAPAAATTAGAGAGAGVGAGAGAGAKVGLGARILEAGKSALKTGISTLTKPETIARITLLAASGSMSGLSPEDQRLVELRRRELKEMAQTNNALFEEQVSAAQNFMKMAEQQAPNPQQAFAQTKIAAERQLAEQTRGLGASEAALAQRRAAIRSTQTGATAAAAEEQRGRAAQTQLTQAGLSSLPKSAPEKYAGMAMPMYEDLAERARQTRSDTAYAVTRAAPDLFGDIGDPDS